MIRDSVIQLFLRNMLLDGFQSHNINIPIQYEGLKKQNLKGTYAVQTLLPLTQWAYNDNVQGGSGLYKITVFSDIGNGLAFTDLVDSVKDIFKRGVYTVDEQQNITLCIDNPITSPSIYEKNTDKVQRSVSIEYRKFKN